MKGLYVPILFKAMKCITYRMCFGQVPYEGTVCFNWANTRKCIDPDARSVRQWNCSSGTQRSHTQTDGRQSDVNSVLSRFLYSMSGLGVDGVWLKPDRKLVGQ